MSQNRTLIDGSKRTASTPKFQLPTPKAIGARDLGEKGPSG
jgi:hypothetical protein